METRIDRWSVNGAIESNTIWEYDTAAYGLGQLASVQDTQFGFMRPMIYDSLGRPSEAITNFGGGAYYQKTIFVQFGRVYQAFGAAGDRSYTSDGIVMLHRLGRDQSRSHWSTATVARGTKVGRSRAFR